MKIRFLESHRIRTPDQQMYEKGKTYDIPLPVARFYLERNLAVAAELETATAVPQTETATLKTGVRTVGTENQTDVGSGD